MTQPDDSGAETGGDAPAREEDAQPPGLHPGGSFIVDTRGIVLAFDVRMEKLTGWPAIEVVGRHKDLAGAKNSANGYSSVALKPLYEGTLPAPLPTNGLDLRVHCRDGGILDVKAAARYQGGTGGRIYLTVLEVLARSEAPGQAGAGVLRDHLTGLEEQGAFRERLAQELAAAAANARPLALILADVDHLRRINDRMGRAAGDDVLVKLAGILRAASGENDMVARLDDDAFAIILVGAGRGEARQVAGRIRANMEHLRLLCGRVGTPAIRVTLSLGASSFPADADGESDLLERAGEALQQARKLGRNRVWCYARRARVPVKTPVYFDGSEPLIVGFSRDLSPSGIFVQTPAPLDAGMRCALAFPLPGTEENIHVIGRVVRAVLPEAISENPAELSAGMAIEFERFGPEDRRSIESYLHSVMNRPERGLKAAY